MIENQSTRSSILKICWMKFDIFLAYEYFLLFLAIYFI